ncbi:MAG: sulfotransferase, partial [Methylococcales bacterium]
MNIDINKILDEADSLIATFQYEKAIISYNHILQNVNDCADALLMRGALLGEMGRIDEAISDIEKSIVFDKKNGSSYLTLAYLYDRKQNEIKVLELCRISINLSNNNDAIKLFLQTSIKLGNEALELSFFDEAEAYFTSALEVAGNNAGILYKLVLVLRGKGDVLESIEMAKKVVSADPSHIRAKAHIASSYEITGDIEKGYELIKKIKYEHPEHPLVNIVYAQYALRNNNFQEGILALEMLLNNKKLSQYDRISAEMLLADLYDKDKSFEKAFVYYKQANDSQNNDYDSSSYKNYITYLIDYFSVEQYRSLPVSNISSKEMIFIVGMPRSGTSLIEQIISSHSSVFGAGELPNVNILVNSLKQQNFTNEFPFCLNEIDVNLMSDLANKLLVSIKARSDRSLKIVDKMPNNFHYIAFLSKLLPNAKFINCVRDPRDTCLSIYFKNFTGHHPYASDFHNLAVHYLEYERLMSHWVDGLGIPVYTVKYENVVTDTKGEVEKLLKFLDLNWEDSCMSFYNKKRISATASYN